MSKSLEALDELCSRCYVESEKCTCHARYKGGKCYTSCEYKEQIKQDLERLEHLEKENQKLKLEIKRKIKITNNHIQAVKNYRLLKEMLK